MTNKKNVSPKSVPESFVEMVGQLGSALGEIFRDPKVKEKAQEFAKSVTETAQAFADQFKDEKVQNKFKQAGQAAQEFGEKVSNYFETEKEHPFQEKDKNVSKKGFNHIINEVTCWGEKIKIKKDNYFTRTRSQRLVSYTSAIAWNFIILIFVNFFHQYIAYYHYEVMEGVGQWIREPLLTDGFGVVLPILSVTLILYILGNGIKIIFDKYFLHQALFIILSIFALATIFNFLTVFPFDFTVVPFPYAPQVLSVILTIIFIAVIIGLVVGIVVSIVRVIIATIKG